MSTQADKPDRGALLLDTIYDIVDHRLNPEGDECWHCGGEGVTSDCFEEFACIDPEGGCSACSQPCVECRRYAAQRAKAVREEVIQSGDIDTAIAWIKSVGRWHDGITTEQVKAEMEAAAETLRRQAGSEAAVAHPASVSSKGDSDHG